MNRGLEKRVTQLEAENATNDRLDAEGPPLQFAEALRRARERALQQEIDGHPQPTHEEIVARSREVFDRYWAKRGR